MQSLLKEYHDGMEAIVVNGVQSAWTLANNKNDEPFSKYNGDSLSIYDIWNGSAKYDFGHEF